MKKRVSALLFAAALFAVSAVSVCAAGFSKANTYTDGQFTDVKTGEWYVESVKTAYELGFMNGKSQNSFAPNDNVTAAEVITVAARMNAVYNGKTVPEAKSVEKWYDTYVNYAKQNGIISDGDFSSYDAYATRAESAEVFASALPADWYKPQNDVKKVPDVPQSNKYAEKLLMLYKAGVVMGSDEYGTFNPTDNIKRSEISAIIGRAALPETRLKKTLENADIGDAYYLIDEPNGIPVGTSSVYDSAWNYDNRNLVAAVANLPVTFADHSDVLPITVWRDLEDTSEGTLTLDMTFSVNGAENGGVYFAITDDRKNDVAKISFDGGKMLLNGKDTGYSCKAANAVHIKLECNLDTHKSLLYADGKYIGEFAINDGTAGRFYAGTEEKAKEVEFGVSSLYIYKNYLVNELFADAANPDDWKLEGAFATVKTGGQSGGDLTSMGIDAKSGSVNTAYKSFGKVSGNVVFETLVLLPESASGASVSLNAGSNSIASVTLNNGAVVNKSGKILRNVSSNVWQTLRIEASTAKGTVTYKVNGKDCGTYALDANKNYADGITVSFAPETDAKMYFDDVKVYLTHEYDDYCPEPVPALSEDYDVMLNVCSIWREGSHRGWEAVSAYEDKRPYLGFYDEGIPEVADWEIKYMLEHGIGIQHICWYGTSDDIKEPIKKSKYNSALHNGFFNAKYSDMIDFCIMWENAGKHVSSLEQFKEYIWKYWAEYYFTDSRYAKIDNKAIITVWSQTNFLASFGGNDGAAKAIEFMREDIKNYGYDGIIFLFMQGVGVTSDTLKTAAKIGADGVYAYNWGTDGYDAAKVIAYNEKNYSANAIHAVPSASVGFNNIGWVTERKPMSTVSDFKKQLDYIKDTYLPKIKAKSGTENWKKRLVLASTWNEYGEGTYIAPAGVHGFGYLDAVRETFTGTKSPDYADVKPTENQLSRLGHLYTGDKITLANYDYINETDGREYNSDDVVTITVDGAKYEPSKKITLHADGEVYAVAEPRTGFFSLHNFYYEWKPTAKTLYILTKNNTEIVFTVESDTATVNGIQKKLPSKVTLYDGLPLVPYKWLMSEAGLKYTQNGSEIKTTAASEEYADAVADRSAYRFEFNVPGDKEGWRFSNFEGEIKDGVLSGISTVTSNGKYDPMMFASLGNGLDAGKYYKFVVRMKADIPEGQNTKTKMFYTTMNDATWGNGKVSKEISFSSDEANQYREYEFDFSEQTSWNGLITGLRFDPIEGEGSFDIDYIRFIYDPDGVSQKLFNDEKFEIINGDAENEKLAGAFYSSNAKITVTEDPDKPGNHVYRVISKEGKNWTYIRQKVLFSNGKTYKISFDVKHLGTNTGLTNVNGGITVNLIYKDKDGKENHLIHLSEPKPSAGWVHCETEYKLDNLSEETYFGEFTVYSEPNNELGCNYLIDNIAVTETDAE